MLGRVVRWPPNTMIGIVYMYTLCGAESIDKHVYSYSYSRILLRAGCSRYYQPSEISTGWPLNHPVPGRLQNTCADWIKRPPSTVMKEMLIAFTWKEYLQPAWPPCLQALLSRCLRAPLCPRQRLCQSHTRSIGWWGSGQRISTVRQPSCTNAGCCCGRGP